MGYAVKKNPNGIVSPFKLYLRTAAKDDKGQYVREDKYIPASEYKLHGFTAELTFEEAKKRASELNAQSEVKRFAAKKAGAAERVRQEAKILSAFVTDEEAFLEYAKDNLRVAAIKSNKFASHWHRTKHLIGELKIAPPEFEDCARRIYRYFIEKQFAVGYCQKLLRCLNLYGRFYAKRYKVYVGEVPHPTGYDRADIEDAYLDKCPNGKASKPLSPALLEKLKDMPPEQYNWMYISLWCGLRPPEVDLLKKKANIKWEVKEGVTVLWVFQEKLRKLPRPQRWKPIPFVEPEQADLKKLIESEKYERPLVKTITARIGEGYNLYAGRKGFEPMMLDRGHDFVHVSEWMGHQSVERTYSTYRDRTKVRFKKPA